MGELAMPGVARLLISQLAAFVALLLAASAIHKVMRRERAVRVVHEFAGVPGSAAPWTVLGVTLGELLAGGLLFLPAYRLDGALLALVIFGAYLALILRAIVQGRRDVDCGCSFGPTRHALGAFEVARNSLLMIFAVLLAVSSTSGGEPVSATQTLAAFALLALYGALDQVMSLQPMRRGEVV
jgi:Methylamine utilisation protein MauE